MYLNVEFAVCVRTYLSFNSINRHCYFGDKMIQRLLNNYILYYTNNATSIGPCARYPMIRCRNGPITLESVCPLRRLILIKSCGKYKYRLFMRCEMKYHCSFHIKRQHVHLQNWSGIFGSKSFWRISKWYFVSYRHEKTINKRSTRYIVN